jgi:peroxiredoxin
MLWLYLLAFCRITIGLTFAYSFLMKVRDVNQFAQTIANFRLVPLRWGRPLALLFLSGEVAVVILLLLGGVWLPLAFTLVLILLAAFTIALVAVLVRNIQTTCHCFGRSDKPVTSADVWRNGGLVLLAAGGWWLVPQVGEGWTVQNWLVSLGEGLGSVAADDRLLAVLTISAILTWLTLLLIVFFLLLLAKRLRQMNQRSPKEAILEEAHSHRGQSAPPFEAQDMAGETVTLDTFEGKDVAFIFLSPSCAPCVERLPELNSYYSQGQANGMEMVIVNVDEHISAEAFVRQHGVQPPVLWAPQVSNPFAHDYDADSTPSFCLVDATQRIRASGFLDSHYWAEQLALMKS